MVCFAAIDKGNNLETKKSPLHPFPWPSLSFPLQRWPVRWALYERPEFSHSAQSPDFSILRCVFYKLIKSNSDYE